MKLALWIVLVIFAAGAIFLLVRLQKNSKYRSVDPPANQVEAKNFAFNPQTLTISTGTQVTFVNNDTTTHTFTFTDFDSGDITPGQTFKHTFSTAGTYDYHCKIHPSMQGKIVVQ